MFGCGEDSYVPRLGADRSTMYSTSSSAFSSVRFRSRVSSFTQIPNIQYFHGGDISSIEDDFLSMRTLLLVMRQMERNGRSPYWPIYEQYRLPDVVLSSSSFPLFVNLGLRIGLSTLFPIWNFVSIQIPSD